MVAVHGFFFCVWLVVIAVFYFKPTSVFCVLSKPEILELFRWDILVHALGQDILECVTNFLYICVSFLHICFIFIESFAISSYNDPKFIRRLLFQWATTSVLVWSKADIINIISLKINLFSPLYRWVGVKHQSLTHLQQFDRIVF